ncbi:MAG: leucine-rich repeat domain-containing protein [Paludibacter sp.]|nr:leucine-rich repeat domain-containing protein [Paludibacter sp.]
MNISVKTFFLFSLVTTICVSCKNTDEPEVNQKRTINLVISGSLSTILTVQELKSISNLTLSGTIDARDFKTIRDNMSALDTLDLSVVTIAAYKGLEGTTDETNHEYLANEIPSDAISYKLWNLHLILPNSITSIGNYAFTNIYSIRKLTIPNSVVSIGRCAFSSCGFDSIILPSSLKIIGQEAFSRCTRLKYISIPNSVELIDGYAFMHCPDLIGITLGNETSFIDKDAFDFCPNLEYIEISPENTKYSSNDGILYNKKKTVLIKCPEGKSGNTTLANSLIEIQDGSFEYCTKLTGILLGSSITKIGNNAFYNCNSLTEMNLGNSVNEIGNEIFLSCDSLKTVTLNNSIKSLPNGTFHDCINLTNVSLGNSIVSIDDNAFMGCRKLKTLTIPATVKSIGICVFTDAKELKSLYILSKTPIPFNSPNFVFDDDNFLNCNLYVPLGSKSSYKSNILWGRFINIFEM